MWADYASDKPNLDGGLILRVMTPRDRYFLTTAKKDGVIEDSHFRAASTTKTFTATSILLLAQRDMLDINDRITDTIPSREIPYTPDTDEYAIPYKDEITIKLLLQHRAGVFDVSNDPIPSSVTAPYAGQYYFNYVREVLGADDHTFTFDELVSVVASNGLTYGAPDTFYHYSNTGYSILGKIIERVSGMSYQAFVQTNLFALNGLTGSSLPIEGCDCSIPAPFVEGHVLYEGAVYETTEDNMSANVAEGNLITTPRDLSEWAYRLYRGEAGLSEKYLAMMMDCKETGESHGFYGLGCAYTPGLGYGHNGAHAGYMTVVRYDPDNEVTMLLVASVLNIDDLNGQLDFMYEVAFEARRILGYPAE